MESRERLIRLKKFQVDEWRATTAKSAAAPGASLTGVAVAHPPLR
jgi:hypothetical protein